MIRGFFRLIGMILLVIAFIALALDGAAMLATGEVKFAIAGQSWTELAPASLNQVQFGIQEKLGLVWFWDHVVQQILLWPTALVIALLALVFFFLGRRRRKPSVFAA